MKSLDLRKLPTKLINLDRQPDRLALVSSRLNELGIKFDRFSAIPHERGIVGCGQSHLEVLSNIKPGTLVFEDDVVPTERYQPVIEIPEEADAIYLGVSNWGYVRPHMDRAYHNVVMASQHDDNYKRVYNMCSAHAIVYLSERFIKGAANVAESCLRRDIPWDLGLAAIQRHYTILTPNKPYFFQEDLPEYTNFTLEV